MDFEIDPLFKKTSAKFDESGAKGLLLNNLNVNYNSFIIR
jgi:condensin complex subunit 2